MPSSSSSRPSNTAQATSLQSVQHVAPVPAASTGSVSSGNGALELNLVRLYDVSVGATSRLASFKRLPSIMTSPKCLWQAPSTGAAADRGKENRVQHNNVGQQLTQPLDTASAKKQEVHCSALFQDAA